MAEASTLFVKEMSPLMSKRRVSSWNVPPRLVSVQVLSVHIMDFLQRVHKDATLCESAGTSFFCKGLTSCWAISTAWMEKRF